MDAEAVLVLCSFALTLVLPFVASVAMLGDRPWALSPSGQKAFFAGVGLVYGTVLASKVVSNIRAATAPATSFGADVFQYQPPVHWADTGQFITTGLLAVALAVLSTRGRDTRKRWLRASGAQVSLLAWIALLFTSADTRLPSPGLATLLLPVAVLVGNFGGVLADRRASPSPPLIDSRGDLPGELASSYEAWLERPSSRTWLRFEDLLEKTLPDLAGGFEGAQRLAELFPEACANPRFEQLMDFVRRH